MTVFDSLGRQPSDRDSYTDKECDRDAVMERNRMTVTGTQIQTENVTDMQ